MLVNQRHLFHSRFGSPFSSRSSTPSYDFVPHSLCHTEVALIATHLHAEVVVVMSVALGIVSPALSSATLGKRVRQREALIGFF